jgi:hypothetical protein
VLLVNPVKNIPDLLLKAKSFTELKNGYELKTIPLEKYNG